MLIHESCKNDHLNMGFQQDFFYIIKFGMLGALFCGFIPANSTCCL